MRYLVDQDTFHDLVKLYVREACVDKVLLDSRFWEWPASVNKHHNWSGGLAQHTLEVIQIALKMAEEIACNKEVLVTAAVWHDYGKLWSYQRCPYYGVPAIGKIYPQWQNAPERLLIGGHIAKSYSEYITHAKSIGVDDKRVEHIAHCILSHHQCQEWGSPASPQTKESWVLHLADSASARCLGGEKLYEF